MEKLLRKYGLFIDGKESNSVSGKTYIRENPATEEPFAEIAEAQKEDVDRAVKAAKHAFEKWSHVAPRERAKFISSLAELLEKHKEHIAMTNTLETGKPIRESRLVELGNSIRTLEYYAGAATKLNGESISVSDDQLTITLKEPEGVFNVIPGRGSVAGQALIEHPDIAKIAFTGSTEVGKGVMNTASQHIKRVSLELGGKAPCIVFDDAEIEEAVEANLRGGFFNQGENCTAVTRLLLHEDIYDRFLTSYIDRVKKIRLGDPTKDETEMGSLVSRSQFESVKSYFNKGIEEGAKVLHGGGRPKEFPKGYFFEPAVLADVKPSSTVACDEIFGPIVAVMPFKTEEEAIRISNDTIYGLAGGIWTQNIKRALKMAKAIKAGYLWVNTYGGIIPETPYGGFKQSGIGKELGTEGLDMYLETKAVNIYLGDKIPRWYRG